MAVNDLPLSETGYLIRGEGREIHVSCAGGWPAVPVLWLAGVVVAAPPTVTGDLAVWSLTPEQVAALDAGAGVSARVSFWVTVAGVSQSAGALWLVDRGVGSPGPRVGPLSVVVGPPGRGVAGLSIDGAGHLVAAMTDESTEDAGPLLSLVEDLAGDLSAAVSSAATSATTATTKASEAATSATTATTQATTATTKASEANTSAAAASASESSAATSATTATTKASEAATSATTAANNAAAAVGVTLGTAQTITGVKTMTAPVLVQVTPGATYGADLTPAGGLGDAGWTLAGGATWASPNLTIPSGGSISCSVAGIESGATYQIEVTRSASSGGDMAYTLGSASAVVPSWSTSKVTLVAAESGTLTLTLGGGTWVATVQAVTCRKVTATASPVVVAGVEQRTSTTAPGLTAVGRDAARSATTASNLTAVGVGAGYSATTASNLTAVGRDAARSATTASSLTVVGVSAARSATTASNLTAVGVDAARAIVTAAGHASLGRSAGHTDGTTASTDSAYTTCLGYNAQATVPNVAVIGSALSAERQTLCIGNHNALGSNVRGGVALTNAQTVPTTNPTGGGILYAEAGALKWRGSSGTVTVIAAA